MAAILSHRSHDALLLLLKVFVELGTSPVVPHQVRILGVGVEHFQHLGGTGGGDLNVPEEDELHPPLQALSW